MEPAKEDISVAIAKLDYGIDDVSKQIKNVVSLRPLRPTASVAMSQYRLPRTTRIYWSRLRGLENSVGLCRLFEKGLMRSMYPWKSAYARQSRANAVLILCLLRLRQKIRYPYQTMQANVKRLQRLQQASDVLRRTSRFTILVKRLQTQMAEVGDSAGGTTSRPKASESKGNNGVPDGQRSATPGLDYEGEKERSLAQAALTIAELGREVHWRNTRMAAEYRRVRRPFGEFL